MPNWHYLRFREARHVTRGGEGGGVSPALFRKLEKSALIWRKNALIVVIYGYNFSLKTKFSRVSRRKTCILFHLGAFFSRVVGECLSKCPKSNSPALKNHGYAPGDSLFWSVNRTSVNENLVFVCLALSMNVVQYLLAVQIVYLAQK